MKKIQHGRHPVFTSPDLSDYQTAAEMLVLHPSIKLYGRLEKVEKLTGKVVLAGDDQNNNCQNNDDAYTILDFLAHCSVI